MTARLFLPIAALSLLALAACDNRTEAPAVPDPDAGNPEAFAEPVEDDTELLDDAPMTPAEMAQRREEIEREAEETFESIMEETGRAGDTLVELGDDAMSTLSNQVDAASDAIATQIDALVEDAARFRDENLTDEQKLEIVARTRTAAEEAARALGQSQAGIDTAGDTAEQRARQVLEVQ